jgi:hypothetical protein
MVAAILDFLPSLEQDDRDKLLESTDETGATALISAGQSHLSWEGAEPGGHSLIAKPDHVALQFCCTASVGNLEIITLLVGAGANVQAVNQKGVTPL